MCHKVIATYQQTFQNTSYLSKNGYFKFDRIYKSKPEQYFNVKCCSLTSVVKSTKIDPTAENSHCGEMYLIGLPAINKSCNFSTQSLLSEITQDNRCYLGNLNGDVNDSGFIVNEIPLDLFILYNDNFAGTFTVCFHIELIQP